MVKKKARRTGAKSKVPKDVTGESKGLETLPPELLEQIFGYLPLRDLLSCRLVHPSLRAAAANPCRKLTKRILFSNDTDVDFRHQLLAQFLKTVSPTGSDHFPIGEISIDLNSIDEWLEDVTNRDIIKFLETITCFVHELTLEVSLGGEFQYPPDLIPPTYEFKKLQKLNLVIGSDNPPVEDRDWDDDCVFNFISAIVEKTKTLKTITLTIAKPITNPETLPRFMVRSGILRNLQLFSGLSVKAPLGCLEYFIKSDIKLKSVCVSLEHNPSSAETLSFDLFLYHHSRSLTQLSLLCDNDSPFCIVFPEMKRLTSLQIHCKASVSDDEVSDVSDDEEENDGEPQQSFLGWGPPGQFPALKLLSLLDAKGIWPCFIKELRGDIAPLNTLETLHLPDDFSDEDGIRKAAAMFPNIKKLVIGVQPNLAQAVYNHMPDLEELTLLTRDQQNVGSIDEFITGMNSEEFSKIRGPLASKKNVWMRMLERSPTKSMLSLESLKVLRLHNKFSSWMGKGLEFTEISVIVLKQMKALKCVDLGRRKFSRNFRKFENEKAMLKELKQQFVLLERDSDNRVLRKKYPFEEKDQLLQISYVRLVDIGS